MTTARGPETAPLRAASRRDAYIPIVRSFLPGLEGKELSLRCSILTMRDQATAWMGYCSDEAYVSLEHIQRLALVYAYSSISIPRLEQLQYVMLRLTACAADLDEFSKAGRCPREEVQNGCKEAL